MPTHLTARKIAARQTAVASPQAEALASTPAGKKALHAVVVAEARREAKAAQKYLPGAEFNVRRLKDKQGRPVWSVEGPAESGFVLRVQGDRLIKTSHALGGEASVAVPRPATLEGLKKAAARVLRLPIAETAQLLAETPQGRATVEGELYKWMTREHLEAEKIFGKSETPYFNLRRVKIGGRQAWSVEGPVESGFVLQLKGDVLRLNGHAVDGVVKRKVGAPLSLQTLGVGVRKAINTPITENAG